jgi:lipoyl(octanoyl) transferase
MESATDLTDFARARASQSAAQCARLLVTTPADGATNMAVDEALMRRASRSGETIFRVYAWSSPTVSLGRNQIARGRYDLERAQARGIGFVRRPTGGRAILHHRELTYSVAGPATGFGSLAESYRRVNRLLLDALRMVGVEAQEAKSLGRPPIPGLAPCFEAPVTGELVVDGRKLVGSAQLRDGDAFLQHGSILVDDDQPLLAELLHDGRSSSVPSTLRALTGRAVTVPEFAEALGKAVHVHDGLAPRAFEPDQSLLDDVELLVRTRYEAAGWTWRR